MKTIITIEGWIKPNKELALTNHVHCEYKGQEYNRYVHLILEECDDSALEDQMLKALKESVSELIEISQGLPKKEIDATT